MLPLPAARGLNILPTIIIYPAHPEFVTYREYREGAPVSPSRDERNRSVLPVRASETETTDARAEKKEGKESQLFGAGLEPGASCLPVSSQTFFSPARPWDWRSCDTRSRRGSRGKLPRSFRRIISACRHLLQRLCSLL
ncbi:hypothetical protein SKAU_G00292220 [Synaphobranchus kaupii]|uniref:Uncharacterized protein n=1 Tax=Synaphobranchus kaupii TaxID=118154 RepID=A0A9Q1IM74_SYNKA|nr:hypothetical protein SKAU_G00292220 [Synaphobranchus kaupii]